MNTRKIQNVFLKALVGLFLLVGFAGVSLAVLRAETSVPVFDGHIRSNSVLSDDDGRVFIEVTKDTYAYRPSVRQFYDGYLLAPEVLPAPEDALMPIMDEIVTFELYTSDNIPVTFVDKRQREIRGVKVLVPIINPGSPSLWEYDVEDNTWRRLGGRLIEDVEGAPSVFVTYINATGIYGVFDELPALGGYELDPDQDIELSGEGIYSSAPVVTPQEELEELYARIAEIEEFLASFEDGELDEMLEDDAPAIVGPEGTQGNLGELALVNELGEIVESVPEEVPFPYAYEGIDSENTESLESVDDVNTSDDESVGNVNSALDQELDAMVAENASVDQEVGVSVDDISLTEDSLEEESTNTAEPQEESEDVTDNQAGESIETTAEEVVEEPLQESAPNLPDTLPQTGTSWLWGVFVLVLMGIAGYEIYDRFFVNNI